MSKWLDKFIWWHRVRRHRVEQGINLFGGSTPYRCTDCQVVWEVFW